jgi:hypothetical protein
MRVSPADASTGAPSGFSRRIRGDDALGTALRTRPLLLLGFLGAVALACYFVPHAP